MTENVACYLTIGPVVDGITHFTVEQSKIVGKKHPMEVEYVFTVKFNEETKDTKCNCRMFESKGVVCAHMVSVWGKMKLRKVPQKYILDRWKKNCMRSHTKVKVSYSNWQRKPEWRRWDQIQDTARVAADKAMHSDMKTAIVVDKLNEAIEAIDMLQDEENVPMFINVNTTMPITGTQKRSNVIGNPAKGPRRGRPPTMRKQSRTEKYVKRKTVGSCQKDQASKRNRLMV